MNRYQLELPEPGALTDRRPAGRISTSIDAFDRQVETGKRRTDQERICDYVTHRGEQGATSHEVCAALGLPMQTVSGRCNDLYRAGVLYRRGDRRTANGSAAKVWRARAR